MSGTCNLPMQQYCYYMCDMASMNWPVWNVTDNKSFFLFEITQYNSDTHNARTFTPYEHMYANLTLYEYFRRLRRQILEIDEVTTGASLSTRTSPTTECTTLLNSIIFILMGSRNQDLMCLLKCKEILPLFNPSSNLLNH